MPLIYLQDIRLNAVVEGPADAPPLLFCHALGTDLTLWVAVIPALSPRFRCIRYDARGHGLSDVPAPPYTMGALIRDAERVLDHFAARDAVVIGCSMGGLVAQGLARIRAGRCTPGVQALLELGQRSLQRVVATDLGFIVGPRINAAGRIDDMTIGIRCLLAESLTEAREMAARLDELNRERRAIEADMQTQALAAVRGLADPADDGRYGLCLYDPGWHQGVVGLVAGRIKERVRRPVIAFADAEAGELRGSARSVPGVHVRDVLEAISSRHPGMVIRFGGHAMAAGLTLDRERLDEFARVFDREVARWQEGGTLADRIETDGALAVEEVSLDIAMALREAGPWGQGFAEPSFDQPFRLHTPKVVGERHPKMWVEPVGSGRRFEARATATATASPACWRTGPRSCSSSSP